MLLNKGSDASHVFLILIRKKSMNKIVKLASVALLTLTAGSALASEASYKSKSVAGGKTEKAVSVSKSSSKFYLKGLVGYNFGQKMSTKGTDAETKKEITVKASAKSQMKLGLGTGYEVIENLRLELMINYLPSSEYNLKGAKGGAKFSVFNPMLNAHYDLGNFNGFTPFASAGAGFSKLSAKNFKSKYSFTYMVGAGVGYEVSQDVIAELSYAYTNYGSAKIKDTDIKSKVHGHSVNAGLRFKL